MGNIPKSKLVLIIGAVALVAIVLVLVSLTKKPSPASAPKLTVWGFDKSDSFDAPIKSFQAANPGAEIKYTQVSRDNYENTLLKALAAGAGPDVFAVPSHSLPALKEAAVPISNLAFTTTDFNSLFPTVASQDFIYKGEVYAMPLYINTLALFYNSDLLDRALIPTPPSDWMEFQADAQKIRALNDKGQLTLAGAAIGGTNKTVSYAPELLTLLLMQNGVAMPSSMSPVARFSTDAGIQGLKFYLQFSDPASPYYTWNEAQGNDLDAFAGGKVGMIFAYGDDKKIIKDKNPFLNFGIAPLPQVSKNSAVAYADYEGLAVSRQSAQATGAWSFVRFITANHDVSLAYLMASEHSPALKSIIQENLNNKDFKVFVSQALIARSYWAPDYTASLSIFNEAISKMFAGNIDASSVLRQAENSFNLLK